MPTRLAHEPASTACQTFASSAWTARATRCIIRTGSHTILFALGAAALILALAIDLTANRATRLRSAAV